MVLLKLGPFLKLKTRGWERVEQGEKKFSEMILRYLAETILSNFISSCFPKYKIDFALVISLWLGRLCPSFFGR